MSQEVLESSTTVQAQEILLHVLTDPYSMIPLSHPDYLISIEYKHTSI